MAFLRNHRPTAARHTETSASPCSPRGRQLLEQIISRGASPAPETAASGLIEEFGSLAAALAGSRLRQTRATRGDVVAVDTIRFLRRVILLCLRSEVSSPSLIDNWAALVRYLRIDLGHAPVERLRILYLDSRSRLLRDEIASSGTIDGTPFYVREIVARALELGASSMVLAHNHPAGDAMPSRGDCENTRLLATTCRGLDIEIHDHVIVCATGVVSLRALGLLNA